MPGLCKKEKLCSRIKIDQLFADGKSFAQYPLRIVYRTHPLNTPDELPQFFVSVPKRKFKHAVDRVWLRRRVREAYRLHKELIPQLEGVTIDMAFLYIAAEKFPYRTIEQSMVNILTKLANTLEQNPK